jgi:trehalose/maltose transport system substrate-binding protein
MCISARKSEASNKSWDVPGGMSAVPVSGFPSIVALAHDRSGQRRSCRREQEEEVPVPYLRETTAVSGLVSDVQLGRISRREALRRGALLGLGASALAMLNVRSFHVARAQDQNWGETIVVPETIRTDLTGQSISFVGDADGPGTPFEEAAVAKFVEATGINVNRVAGDQSASDRLATYLRLLSTESSDIDVMMIDVIWPGILAQYAVDLKDAMASQGVEYFERIVANNTVNDVLVGIPWFTDAGLMYTRTDLQEKYGFEGVPATWDELEERANAIIEGERATNPDFQGFVWQGQAYEGLTCNALEWQVSQGGGNIIEPDGTVSVNNENAIASFERAAGWVGTISPEGVTTYMEEDSRGVWQSGNAAFHRNWPYVYSLSQADDSIIKDLFTLSVIPTGTGEGAQNADTLGGWQMMVSKFAQSPDAAVEFCKYITSLNLQKSYALERSLLPTIGALYEDADVLAANPYYAELLPVFSGGAVARPSTVSADLYNDVSTAYYTAVYEILTGQAEAAGRVEDLEGELEDIMSQL